MRLRATPAIPAALLFLGTSLSACTGNAGTPAASTATAPATVEAGYVTGIAVDTQGKPLAGAKILLENAMFHASYIKGTTQADGRYRLKVQPGVWTPQASLRKDYNGQSFGLELAPDNPDSVDDDGAVRNFTWKLEGRAPDNGYRYYGGFIQLSAGLDLDSDLSDVELTLTPSGPLIDGSEGRTLHLHYGDHYWVDRFQIEDVPIGRYIVTATQKTETGAQRPLRIQDWYTHGDGEFMQEYQLDFMPESAAGNGATASIVIGN